MSDTTDEFGGIAISPAPTPLPQTDEFGGVKVPKVPDEFGGVPVGQPGLVPPVLKLNPYQQALLDHPSLQSQGALEPTTSFIAGVGQDVKAGFPQEKSVAAAAYGKLQDAAPAIFGPGPSSAVPDDMAPEGILPSIGHFFRDAGRGTLGTVADVDQAVLDRKWSGQNLQQVGTDWHQDEQSPLPVQTALAGQGGVGGFAGKTSATVLTMLPRLAASYGLGAIGLPSAVAASAPMVMSDEGKPDPLGAIIAAGLPGVAKAGENFTAAQLAKLPPVQVVAHVMGENPDAVRMQVIQKLGGVTLSSDTFRKYLETGGGALAANAYLLAAQAPETMSLPPEKRGDAIMDNVAQNIATSLLAFSSRPGASKTLGNLKPVLEQKWREANTPPPAAPEAPGQIEVPPKAATPTPQPPAPVAPTPPPEPQPAPPQPTPQPEAPTMPPAPEIIPAPKTTEDFVQNAVAQRMPVSSKLVDDHGYDKQLTEQGYTKVGSMWRPAPTMDDLLGGRGGGRTTFQTPEETLSGMQQNREALQDFIRERTPDVAKLKDPQNVEQAQKILAEKQEQLDDLNARLKWMFPGEKVPAWAKTAAPTPSPAVPTPQTAKPPANVPATPPTAGASPGHSAPAAPAPARPIPTVDEVRNKVPTRALGAIQEYDTNQKIIETGLQPGGKKATTKQIAELQARQQQVVQNYHDAVKESLAPAPPAPAAGGLRERMKIPVSEDQWREMGKYNRDEQIRRWGTYRAKLLEEASQREELEKAGNHAQMAQLMRQQLEDAKRRGAQPGSELVTHLEWLIAEHDRGANPAREGDFPKPEHVAAMGAKGQQLQKMLRDAGFVKGSGVSNAGVKLVKEVAKTNKLRDWPDVKTPEDYDKLISEVRQRLVSTKKLVEPRDIPWRTPFEHDGKRLMVSGYNHAARTKAGKEPFEVHEVDEHGGIKHGKGDRPVAMRFKSREEAEKKLGIKVVDRTAPAEPVEPEETDEAAMAAPGPATPAPTPPVTGMGFAKGFNKSAANQPMPQVMGGLKFVRPIEMPELVRITAQLSGEVPSVQKIPRRGNRVTFGYFKAGKIMLDPSIFQDPEFAAQVLAHEFGHFVDYLPHNTLKRGNMIGHLLSLRGFLQQTLDRKSVV